MEAFKRFPEVVFFDWDGTLADTCHTEFLIMRDVMKAMGKPPLSEGDFLDAPSLSIREYFAAIFSPAEYHGALTTYLEIRSQFPMIHLKTFPEATQLLNLLKSEGVIMGVVSNKEAQVLRDQVNYLGLGHFFASVVGSGDVPEDKPSPRPLEYALELANQAPGKHVWFVGDSAVDMQCAENAGCCPVSVGRHADTFEGKFLKAYDCERFHKLMLEMSWLRKKSEGEKK